ncbi:N-acetylmuramoyl-L-alanine amidase [Atopococcus tabaci]|uniref:N-acetylmuramoyl-L-alanine amidase n=1 Tax=Atopococcus tabaci TaxID=269774 RepID=UPI0006890011|nr:N-acetylmuramoyl-L-alanine amidase [Atopococcus tabaci]
MGKSIIIDAGHGGSDPGATAFGVKEKDWTLKISLYQYERLKELGAAVALTRSKDTTLDSAARTKVFRGQYDYCISNHWNAFNGKARGVETIHSIFADKTFASQLAKAVSNASGLPLRRVFSKKNASGTDWYFMHRLTGTTKTVIIEYGFLDHKEDHARYRTDAIFYAAAESVVEVVCKELGIRYKAPSEKAAATSLYRVQNGAFSKKEQAEALAKKLTGAGFEAVIVKG